DGGVGTMRYRTQAGWALCAALLAWQAGGYAQEPTPTPVSDEQAAYAVVEDFHRALEEGYRDGVLKLLDEGAVSFETGYVEASREQYAGGHLDADLLFSAQVKRQVIHHKATVSGDMAVVLTQSRSDGEFEGQAIRLENTETVVLRRQDGEWKIVHIHWSGHDR